VVDDDAGAVALEVSGHDAELVEIDAGFTQRELRCRALQLE
jgi:hypothetical protein